jgi:RHS repeat-associated protein
LKSATEIIGGGQSWKQTLTYDRYGNRRFAKNDPNETTTIAAGCPTEICNPLIDTAKNRLIGYGYDDGGNTITDAESRTFIYDGKNKQTKVVSNGQTIGEYFYDGDGKRVKKYVPSTGETTIFVYDASGKMVAEYSTIVASQAEAKVSYLTSDHLGSPRINTDKYGDVISRHDYQPFGEEIARPSYGADDVRKKFTGYERDTEIELDFAQARYYNPKHGRFTTVDPLMASADIINPQTFNRYGYVGNNPVNITDPTGLGWGELNGNLKWFDGDPTDGYTPYASLVGQIAGTNQLVVLSATSALTTPVANPAEALRLIAAAVGTGAAFGASALGLGIPVVLAGAYIAAIHYSPGQVDATMDDCMSCGRYIQNHVNMVNKKADELEQQINQSSSWKGETSPADPNSVKPDPKNNEPNNARKPNEPRFKTDSEAATKARELGYRRINERSNGQAVFRRGRSYITRDVDGHNGGAWKKANSVRNLGSNRTRQGTYDEDLNRIGP